jgi:hypothetical protein
MAISNCQEELKTYMVHAAKMEIAIIYKKYQAVFYQVLKAFTQLLLINKGTGPQSPSEALTCDIALSTTSLMNPLHEGDSLTGSQTVCCVD